MNGCANEAAIATHFHFISHSVDADSPPMTLLPSAKSSSPPENGEQSAFMIHNNTISKTLHPRFPVHVIHEGSQDLGRAAMNHEDDRGLRFRKDDGSAGHSLDRQTPRHTHHHHHRFHHSSFLSLLSMCCYREDPPISSTLLPSRSCVDFSGTVTWPRTPLCIVCESGHIDV